ncbi:MAG: pyridine nucleotide-disulfide oxidoreductase [Actinomycetota bacterium]|nr:pyridine nucleotide-disulfide oxidoreductase [Actinomycetota bacterium]
MRAVPTIAVVGAGPAGIAAARELRDHVGVRVVLVAPEGRSEYLPGTLAVATGDARAAHYRTQVELAGVEIIPTQVEAIEPGALRICGSWLRSHAVIAAPGLVLDPVGNATRGEVVGFWDPTGAEAAAPRIRAIGRGIVDVVISSLPYRCPPAPYGLAMRLARRARRLGQSLQVRLVTPEEHPLAALGHALGDALLLGCQDAGVEVRLGTEIDPDALTRGVIADTSDRGGADLSIVIPRHRTSPLLAELVDAASPLVTVDGRFATEMTGVFVVGDAAASPYPRAEDPAAWSGTLAAAAVLSELGLDHARIAEAPAPDCFVDHGDGAYGRIRITYPDGPPPGAQPAVAIDPPAPALATDFERAHRRWHALRLEGQ